MEEEDRSSLYDLLEKAPEDWSVRIRLIEAAAMDGDLLEAKRLVRTSPDDRPLPGELQQRIFGLLQEAAERAIHRPEAE